MSGDRDLEIKLAEEYGKAQAILETLQELVEKVKEEPKKSPKLKTTITEFKIQFTYSFDGLTSMRDQINETMEKCVVVSKDVANLDQAVKKLASIRTKLEGEEVTKADCSKWVEDLQGVKVALEKRHQIKKVDSEKQASVSSLTEQLKQKDLLIEQLTKELHEKKEPKS